MKTKVIILTVLIVLSFVKQSAFTQDVETKSKKSNPKIQIALLLDTSNSMDGLIDQAKSQLWKIVNQLSNSNYEQEKPTLEIALYQYGNDGLSSSEGYIKMVTDLTTDLDKISEDLFSLKTYGGQEYCGWVIDNAMKDLNWSESEAVLKLIFIAGNEEFSQGSVSYDKVCKLAKEKEIIVNSIFCGDYEEGIRIYWKNGAELSGGKYMNIDHNAKIAYVETPYDDDIIELNTKLNSTYIAYGSKGEESKNRQEKQDENAAVYGSGNTVERALSKSKDAYNNSQWDLVDAAVENEDIIADMDKSELPVELQDKTTEEITTYIAEKQGERDSLQNQINEINIKRQLYIEEQSSNIQDNTLEAVMLKSIREQAEDNGFSFEE